MSEFNLAKSDYITQQINELGGGYKYVVYTALYGSVDTLHDPVLTLNENVLFVCFSDRKDIQSDVWNIINVESKKDSRMAAKYWKFFGYKSFINQAYFSIWVDSSVKIIDSLSPLLSYFTINNSGSSLLTFHHPERNCVYPELFRVLISGKDSFKNILKTFLFLKRNKYSCGNGLIAGTVLVRRSNNINDNLLDSLMSEWWWCVNNYSTRDQLTFNLLIDKNFYYGVHKYLDINENVYNCRYFKGVRIVGFNSQLDPNARFNFRHKFFYLLLVIKNKIW